MFEDDYIEDDVDELDFDNVREQKRDAKRRQMNVRRQIEARMEEKRLMMELGDNW